MADVAETTQIAARVPVEMVEQLNAIADRNDRSTSAELRLALKAHIEAHREKGAA